MPFGDSATFQRILVLNSYASKYRYTVLETFRGELHQAVVLEVTISQLNAIVTICEANSKYVNYKEPLTYR
jgi:hypothetical protein